MSITNKEPMAFPSFVEQFDFGHWKEMPKSVTYGITLRDYFAIRCPDSEVPDPTWGEVKKFKGLKPDARIEEWDSKWTSEFRCAARYAYADAMLKAREA